MKLWQATKFALVMRYVERMGSGRSAGGDGHRSRISWSRKRNIPGVLSVFSPMILMEFLLAPDRAVRAQAVEEGANACVGSSVEKAGS